MWGVRWRRWKRMGTLFYNRNWRMGSGWRSDQLMQRSLFLFKIWRYFTAICRMPIGLRIMSTRLWTILPQSFFGVGPSVRFLLVWTCRKVIMVWKFTIGPKMMLFVECIMRVYEYVVLLYMLYTPCTWNGLLGKFDRSSICIIWSNNT